jgi:hypothetical protein
MSIDLRTLSDSVHDEATFLWFLMALATDWNEERMVEMENPSLPYSPGALGWENGTIGAMLEAAADWGNASINGLEFYDKPENPWRRVAHILYAGKFYE